VETVIKCVSEDAYKDLQICIEGCKKRIEEERRREKELQEKMRQACEKCGCEVECDEDCRIGISNPEIVCHSECSKEEKELCSQYLLNDELVEEFDPDYDYPTTPSECTSYCLEDNINCWSQEEE